MFLTGREFPRSSVVDPKLGGSTMTSQIMPTIEIHSRYSNHFAERTIFNGALSNLPLNQFDQVSRQENNFLTRNFTTKKTLLKQPEKSYVDQAQQLSTELMGLRP